MEFLCVKNVKKKYFCKAYHLVNNNKWRSIINKKFSIKIDWLNEKIFEYSAHECMM